MHRAVDPSMAGLGSLRVDVRSWGREAGACVRASTGSRSSTKMPGRFSRRVGTFWPRGRGDVRPLAPISVRAPMTTKSSVPASAVSLLPRHRPPALRAGFQTHRRKRVRRGGSRTPLAVSLLTLARSFTEPTGGMNRPQPLTPRTIGDRWHCLRLGTWQRPRRRGVGWRAIDRRAAGAGCGARALVTATPEAPGATASGSPPATRLRLGPSVASTIHPLLICTAILL